MNPTFKHLTKLILSHLLLATFLVIILAVFPVITHSQSTSVTNTATVTSTTTDPNSSNNTDSATGEIQAPQPQIDIQITKNVTPSAVKSNETITFGLEVRNNSQTTVNNILVSDSVPSSLVVESVALGTTPIPFSNNTISYTIPSLNTGQSLTITVVARATERTSTITENNTARVSAENGVTESNTQNNESTAPFTVNPRTADVRVTKTVSRNIISPGETLEYTLSYSNSGPDEARNVRIIDTLPPQLTYISSSSGSNSLNPSSAGQELTFSLNNLPPNSQGEIRIIARANANASGIISNTARILSDTVDPQTNNSTSSVTTIGYIPEVIRTGGAVISGFMAIAGGVLFIRRRRKNLDTDITQKPTNKTT